MPAFRSQDVPPSPHVAPAIRAPELTFHTLSDGRVEDEWSFPSDIWAAACTLRSSLVARGYRDDGRIYGAMKLIGPLPERWKPYWNQKPFEDSNGVVFFVASNRIVNVHLSRHLNPENFVDLLRVTLRWDPTDRPTAADLLTHRWFATSSSLTNELMEG
ncbi:hypothetical protein M405DRAFT_801534 [Rhizopogon salebrosus TDB-379]|nr:hypothetical protein M405DRAFT_801534 [Rhizopogon salebrosus TDB-379]